MAKKNTKISINALEKAIEQIDYTPYKTYEWNGLSIEVKSQLTLEDMLSFVEAVVSSCVNDDGEYYPQLKQSLIIAETITSYTNITLPTNFKNKYAMVNLLVGYTDLMEYIKESINQDQYYEMLDSIDCLIDYKLRNNTEAIDKKTAEVMSTLEDLNQNIDDLFGDLSHEDIHNAMAAISNGTIDEEKLVNAYFNAKQGDADESTTN